MMRLLVVTPWRDASSTTDDEGRSLGAVNEPQTLRSLVLAAKDAHGLSMRQLAVRAQGRGFKVVDTTLNHIAAGTYKSDPKPETVRAIAWLSGVPDEVAFAAAGVPMPGPPFSEELPPGVDNLSPRSRRAAVEVLRALVEAEQKAVADHGQPPMTRAGEIPAIGEQDGGGIATPVPPRSGAPSPDGSASEGETQKPVRSGQVPARPAHGSSPARAPRAAGTTRRRTR